MEAHTSMPVLYSTYIRKIIKSNKNKQVIEIGQLYINHLNLKWVKKYIIVSQLLLAIIQIIKISHSQLQRIAPNAVTKNK